MLIEGLPGTAKTKLARKYIEGSNPGTLPMLSALGVFRAAAASRTGIEYYGSRSCQAGDSMKSIDWKHLAKLNELVSKEFSELKGQPALMLINLAVTDDEEADKLAYNIIATALSLAQESIPSALSAYDQDGVRLTTPILPRGRSSPGLWGWLNGWSASSAR